MDNIEQQVKKVVAEQLSTMKPISRMKALSSPTSVQTLLTPLNWFMALEDTFGIEIPDDQQEKIQTVQDAIDFIEAHKKA